MVEFCELGEEERKLLLTALLGKDYQEKLVCRYCEEKVSVKKSGTMPAVKGDRVVTITCDSPLCIAEYLGDLEGGKSTPDYKKAYYVLMDYWDSLPDEEKPDIDKRLKECGI